MLGETGSRLVKELGPNAHEVRLWPLEARTTAPNACVLEEAISYAEVRASICLSDIQLCGRPFPFFWC